MDSIEQVKDFLKKQADILEINTVRGNVILCKEGIGNDIGEYFGIDSGEFNKPFYYRRIDISAREETILYLSVSHAKKIYQFLKEIFE